MAKDVDGRDISAFTRVFDALSPAMTRRVCRSLQGTEEWLDGVPIVPRRQRIEPMMRSTDTLFGTSPCFTAAACQIRYQRVACSTSALPSALGRVTRKLRS